MRSGIGGILRGLAGQSERTQTTPETQVGIPNQSSWSGLFWRCFWCLAAYAAFPLVFSLLWKVFDAYRDTLFRKYYSLFWLPPNPFVFWFGWWELLPVMFAAQVWPVARTAAYRHWRETRYPNHPAPSKAIHPMEYTDKPGQMPNQFESDLYADHDVPDTSPPEREITINIKNGRKSNKVILPCDWETEAFLIGVLNGATPLSQTGSGWGRARWLKLRKILLDAKLAKWKNFFHHKQGVELTDDGKQIIKETFPQRGK